MSDATERAADEEMRCALEAALVHRSADELDALMPVVWERRVSVRWTSVLARLLHEPWHHHHEDLAIALQDLREPSTIEPLFQMASNASAFASHDDGFALAYKCVWALHDIGTPEAVDALRALQTRAFLEETRGQAAERLADLAKRRPDEPPLSYRVHRDAKVRRT